MHPSLPLDGEIPRRSVPPRCALAAKGFRPFFLLASAFAAAIVPVWILIITGVVRPTAYLDATSWHAHEMVFGFAVAVIAGFLLTAVGNWTHRETAVGAPLLALAALWLGGRVAMIFGGSLPHVVTAMTDLTFLPALIIVLARPLLAAKNRRNFVLLAVLGALFVANVVVHLDALGIVATGSARRACVVAVDIVVLVILIIAGRVVPMFTRNATGVTSIRSIPSLDVLAVAGMAVLTILDGIVPESLGAAVASIAAGLLAAMRTIHWGARHSARQPLLWILHVGYAWVPLGLLLRGFARVDLAVPASLATHALTVGAIGSLTLGMMARVSLGHTGRPLVAAKPIAWAFVAVTAAAVARVVVPVFAPGWYFKALWVAAALWTAAFSTYLVVYTPILSSPRVDREPV